MIEITLPPEVYRRVARGTYQRALLSGDARWSGADLQGKARRYGGRYKASRDAVLARLRAIVPGVSVQPTGKHGLRVLVLGNHPIVVHCG